MAEITKELGRIPVSRGDYQATTEYYKDNIVQYKRSSYQVVSESPIIGIPPINDEDIVNNGWIIFAGTLSEASLIKSNTQDLSGNNVQENLNSAAEKLKELKLESIYDVSAHNNGEVFESLSALLSNSNLSTLIPTSVRHGGMSIRFIQGSVPNSDNKYVQCRLMADSFTIDCRKWAICDEDVYVDNSEYVKILIDIQNKVVKAIKKDGTTVIFGDVDMKKDLNVQGKLSFPSGNFFSLESPEFVKSVVDNNNKVIFGIDNKGVSHFYGGIQGEILPPEPINLSINTNIDSFTGCVNRTYNLIQTKWPHAKVFVCTPLKTGGYSADNGHGENRTYLMYNLIGKYEEDYVNRIKECASLYSLPVIDLYSTIGFNPLNPEQAAIFTHNTIDKLHIVQAGHKYVAEVIYNAIKNMYGTERFTNKKAIFIGDSITSNEAHHTEKVYYKYLTDWLGLKDDGMSDDGITTQDTVDYPKNAGLSGTGYSNFTPLQGAAYTRIPDYNNDYDVVFVFLGVNDFMSSANGVFGKLFN